MIGSDYPYWVRFTYERLPDFCYCCGCMGHGHQECEKWQSSKEVFEANGFPYG